MKNIFLLDMDDTLLDFQRAEKVNFSQTLRSFGVDVNDDLYACFHKINEGLWKLLERGGITRESLMVRRFELLCTECGYDIDFAAVAKRYFDNFPFVCFPFDGAVEFLKTLSARGRVYIVTNGSAVIQKQHIHDAGFIPYLSGVFISEEVGHNKPSKEYADYVKAHIEQFEEARAVWLGDSLTSDMGCANNASVEFILFSPAGKPHGYEGACVRNFEEFLRDIDR